MQFAYSDDEIKEFYTTALMKKTQIKILAQLNDCTIDVMKAKLQELGVYHGQKLATRRPRTKARMTPMVESRNLPDLCRKLVLSDGTVSFWCTIWHNERKSSISSHRVSTLEEALALREDGLQARRDGKLREWGAKQRQLAQEEADNSQE